MNEQFELDLRNNKDTVASTQVAQRLYEQALARFEKGDYESASLVLLKAQEIFRQHDFSSGVIQCLLLQGTVRRDQGQLEAALSLFRQAKELAQTDEDMMAEAETLNLEASVLSYQGADVLAINCLKQALSLIQQLNFKEQELKFHCNIGALYRGLGDFEQSLVHLTLAYDTARGLNKATKAEAITMSQLGLLYKEMNDIENAIVFQNKARALSVELNDTYSLTVTINNLAELRLLQNDYFSATSLYKEALDLAQKAGLSIFIIDNLSGLGSVYAQLGNPEKAINQYMAALKIAYEAGKRDAQVETLLKLGENYLHIADFHQAIETLEEALQISLELEHPKSIYESHLLLSKVHEKLGAFAKSLYHHKEFHKFERQIYNREADLRTQQLSVQFDVERSKHEAQTYRLKNEVAQRARQEAEKIVIDRTKDLESAHLEIITRLAIAAEYRDDQTGEHTKRVGRTSAAIAHALGWPRDKIKLLYIAARLHDVGKIGISDTILLKPAKLTDEEYEIVKSHTIIGGRILKEGQTELLKLAEEIALYHHERFDGFGYPFKLVGEAIPMSARIVAVADVIDALSHERPYKEAWSLEETLAEIQDKKGTQFDPMVVEACMEVYSEDLRDIHFSYVRDHIEDIYETPALKKANNEKLFEALENKEDESDLKEEKRETLELQVN